MTLRIPLRAGDFAVALVLAGIGLAWAWLSWKLGLGTAAEPGPGLFPFAIAVLLTAGATGCAVRAIGHRPGEGEETVVAVDAEALKAGLLIAALCLLFADGGFFAVAFVFMWLMLAWVSRRRALPAAIASAIAVAGFWLFFEKILGIELPKGVAVEFLASLVDGLRAAS